MDGQEGEKHYYAERWLQEPKANLWAMSRAAQILTELQLLEIKNLRMLDFGCGTGWFTAILSQFGDSVGVDLAPEPARKFHPELVFHGVDELPAGPFDVVISQEVLEHVPDQSSYIATASKLLRPGGYLILTTPNAKVSLRNPQFLVQPKEMHLTRRQLRDVLCTEFDVVKLYSFFFGYAGWRPYRLQLRFGRYLDAGLHFIAVCKKR